MVGVLRSKVCWIVGLQSHFKNGYVTDEATMDVVRGVGGRSQSASRITH